MSNMIPSQIHSVLLATDLTGNSSVALHYAAGIASTYKARLFLVHVLDPSANNAMDSSSSELRNLVEAATYELHHISQSILAAQGITGKVLVRYGNVRDIIFQVQQECSADMVVLGSSGRQSRKDGKLGSIAEAVLRILPCNVLTVGPHVEQHSFPSKAESVLFLADFSAASSAALPEAVSLAAHLSARLLLLHVYDSEEADFEQLAERREKLCELAQFAEKQRVRAESLVQHGQVAECAVSLAKEKKAAFIVMGAQHGDLEDGTRLHGIVSGIVREAYCPVLTLAEHTETCYQ